MLETVLKKISLRTEFAYICGMLCLAFGVTLQTKAGFGLSVLTVPSYLISLKIDFLSFGMADYLIQLLLLVLLCIILKRLEIRYALAFVTSVLYGVALDLVGLLLKDIQAVTFLQRLLAYILGTPVLSALGVALFFRTTLPLMAHDLFVYEISRHKKRSIEQVKIIYDVTFCILSVGISFLLFGTLQGIGLGTVAYAAVNGIFIAAWGRVLDSFFIFVPKERTHL